MSRNDEWINLKKVLKNGTTGEKLDYIWTYYKWQICIAAFVVAFICGMFYYGFSGNDYVLSGVLLGTNGNSAAAEKLKEDFLRDKPIGDPEDIFMDASALFALGAGEMNPGISFEAKQTLMARIAAGEVDFMIAEQAELCNYAYNYCLCELSQVLTAEQMKKYEPYFLYYDRAVLKEMENADLPVEGAQKIPIPDPTKPEDMEEPVPVMLDIGIHTKLSELYPNASKSYAMAFVVNGPNANNVVEWLDYLLSAE